MVRSQGGSRLSSAARQLLQEIHAELVKLRRQGEARARMEDGTPLSRAEFCRLLRIDLKTTLEPLIEAHKLKTVPWTKGEVRIPVAELRRFQRDGIPSLQAPRRIEMPKKGAPDFNPFEGSFKSIPIK
jgi:hypothetical protein